MKKAAGLGYEKIHKEKAEEAKHLMSRGASKYFKRKRA